MFMITAVGTAIKIHQQETFLKEHHSAEKVENVSLEKIKTLKKKQAILQKAERDYWNVDDADWQFITANATQEVFPVLYKKYKSFGQTQEATNFYEKFLSYLNAFSDEPKKELIIPIFLREADQNAINLLLTFIRDLDLLDLEFVYSTLVHDDFPNKKKALQMLPYDKPFYNAADINQLLQIKQSILEIFTEKGVKSIKKGSLLSKEKEVWTCPLWLN